METLKFLFTSSFYPPYHLGGDANHVEYLAEELVRRGHEVHVLHSIDAYRVKRRSPLPQSTMTNGVITHPLVTHLSLSAYEAYIRGNSRTVEKQFQTLVKELRPDVVHHHNISLLGYRLLRKLGDYVNLYTAHDYWLICPRNDLLTCAGTICDKASCLACGLSYNRPPQLWRYRSGFMNAVQDIDVLIAPSNYIKQKLASKISVDSVTIPNFVPHPPPGNAPRSSDSLMYVGMLEKHKGILLLLKAYRNFARRLGLKLIVVGDGSLREAIVAAVRKYDLTDLVSVMGWVGDRILLYTMLRDASALVIPSVSPENAPLASLEGLSVGTPVVSTDVGGLPEIVSRVAKELLFSWGDESQLNRAIEFSIENSPHLRLVAERVYLENFSPEAFLASYSSLLSGTAERN